jgi:Asp-tRNA(Asn)/Glu-tRNA(Gln) amidotransferase A subunit family amidase
MTGWVGRPATETAAAVRSGTVQLVAAPGGEALLLAVAAQLERVRGWRRHAPAYS